MQDMFRGVVPFIILQLIVLAIVAAFPPLVLWLPSVLLGFK
jgi:TRAP-type mannitol/chloroaromatic compound transport system permease large subunit